MSSNEHMSIWREVEETAPTATKQADLQGRQVTSINGTYMVKRATELFGPMGMGWGVVVNEERFDQGAPFYDKAGTLLGHECMHTIRLTLWYMQDGKRGEVTHFGHTPYILGTKFGLKTDMDAPKKSMTDAIKKCLSMLGFSADIFLGQYDDVEYVEAARVKESVEAAHDRDEALSEARKKFLAWFEREIKTYAMIPNRAVLQLTLDGHIKSILHKCASVNIPPEKFVERIKARCQERRDELAPKPVALVCTGCGAEGEGQPGDPCKECNTPTIKQDTNKDTNA